MYWGPREETLTECSEKIALTISVLRKYGITEFVDPKSTKIDFGSVEISDLLKVNKTDIGKRPIKELGWSMRLRNGPRSKIAFTLSIQCGGYSKHVGNSVVLLLPSQGELSIVDDPKRCESLFDHLVPVWEPDQAIITDGEFDWAGTTIKPLTKPLKLLADCK